MHNFGSFLNLTEAGPTESNSHAVTMVENCLTGSLERGASVCHFVA